LDVQEDFRDLLALFNEHKVDYVIVGAYALAFHGVPRFTGDLDILIHPTAENAERVMAALEAFGFGALDLSARDFQQADQVVQLGVPPVRIDIMTSLTGVDWEDVVAGRSAGRYGDVPISYLGREQFIANKRALRRKKDLADLEALGEE